MKLFISIIISFGVAMSVGAEHVRVETNSFTFQLPEDWKIIELSSQAKISGPNDEYLIVSSYNISGEGDKSNLNSIKEEFGKQITKTLKQAASEPDLNITYPLKKEITPNGYPVWSIRTETKDKSQFFDQYGTIGIKTAIMVSLEGDLKDKTSSEVVLNAVCYIKWH